MNYFPEAIAPQIWDMKYRLKKADGTAIDRNIEDTWQRIAKDIARVEDNAELWEKFLGSFSRF